MAIKEFYSGYVGVLCHAYNSYMKVCDPLPKSTPQQMVYNRSQWDL